MKHILSLLFALTLCLTSLAKPKPCTVYMFGVGVSFTDSIAYLTEVHPVTPAYIETSTGFLYDRSLYALQLKNLLEEKYHLPNTTCVVFFSKSKKKSERKREKVRNGYLGSEAVTVMRMPKEIFTFFPEEWESHETTDPFEEQ
ncbi:MAG: hypothetical protein J6035_00255 [Bacteroidaceae bacterium]|nr:hypothetical protein [Bacteroidaceae bacterium]